MKITAIGIVCLAIAIAIAFGYAFVSKLQRGKKIIEAWETTNGTFKIGVRVYPEENGGFVPGAYYVFRSAQLTSDGWQEIFTFRHDDPVPIPQKQIHFVSDKIGYVFMGWMYASTTDGGSKWSVWSAEKDLPGWQCCNYRLIQDVSVAPNGVGTMKLNPIPGRSGELPELRTKDYGRHWSLQ
jgi:hypothetical protein